MNPEDLEALYEEISKPYSAKEFERHNESRLIKSWFEITHAHNYDLIALLTAWTGYLNGKNPRPERKLWVMLRPGSNNDNAACARLHDIVAYFSQYEHGKVPRLPIIVYTSRSSATLIDRLDDFFYSKHITEANHHLKEFFSLISYQGEPKLSRGEFAAEMRGEIDAFIGECAQYAVELGEFIREKEAAKTQNPEPLKVEIVKPEHPVKPKRSKLGKGPQTPFKRLQRGEFDRFLEKHPITPSISKFQLARRCWLEHKRDWDEAAANGRGYADYKSLSRSV